MNEIHLWGVKQNNLKNIEVKIPLGSFTVICGPSGSGKSSLAFETLFAEGQRRFIESMSNYTKQFLSKVPQPDFEGIENIPPSIAIEQKNSIRSSRSTVGTTTEIIDYLRLLFEKLSKPHCPTHKIRTEKHTVSEAAKKILSQFSGSRGFILVEIKKEGRIFSRKEFLTKFIQEGFLRILLVKDNVQNPIGIINSGRKSENKVSDFQDFFSVEELSDKKFSRFGVPKETFYLVIDRLHITNEESSRLIDSLTLAYEKSLLFNPKMNVRQAFVINTDGMGMRLKEQDSCPLCDYSPPQITNRLFSFNSPLGACPHCKGFGNIFSIDSEKVVPYPELSLRQGAIQPFAMPSSKTTFKKMLQYCRKSNIDVDLPWKDLPAAHRKLLWEGDKDLFGVLDLFNYLEQKKYKLHVRVFISRFRSPISCPECKGSRLRSEVHYFLLKGFSIDDLSNMTIEELYNKISRLSFSQFELEVAGEVINQILSRLEFLLRVGVHYLTLRRESRSLSGGEYQRIMLANQLGMGLSQSLFVLDEPTIGLHPRDNERLISILKELKNLGNTLVIIEHDQEVIENSDYLIELGPGSGYLGGQIVYSGSTQNFYHSSNSITAPYLLSHKQQTPFLEQGRMVDLSVYKYKISIEGASGNNLKNISVDFPLNRLIAVTGVSGSGKSTLISRTLYPALAKILSPERLPCEPFQNISGSEYIKNVLFIDQSSTGFSARSNPVTYLEAFDYIRNLFATQTESKRRGYKPGTFSLNVDGGRCPSCLGTGVEEIDMMFMDNIILICDSCEGKKYRSEVLEITYNNKNIYEILSMTVAEAMDFFVASPQIRKPLSVLREVGLEYLQLGQSSSTLSGGESQRLKIAKELSRSLQKATLYILDEPTTGLHFREINMLMNVLNKLVETGGSVILIEHNLEVIKRCDYVIDLGPEGGEKGGYLVAHGTPKEIANNPQSLTGKYILNKLSSFETNS